MTNQLISELTPEECKPHIEEFKIIDVRRPDEFNNELGHIAGAVLISIGPMFESNLEKIDKNQKILFVCRSGSRSAHTTEFALHKGFTDVHNMAGGMIRWNELGYEVE